jgi:16S rRNA (adenine1518-N6/adenine1519-N6)-dimethyltransferase
VSAPAARKAYGQHFLADPNILGVIDRLAGLRPNDVVLEVGPGLGVLTVFLADRVRLVHAIEIDARLEGPLRATLGSRENVHLVIGDALRLDLAALDPVPTRLVANLPYNVATPVVVESLFGLPRLETWCVMVQREVADRFFAAPSKKAYGAVSVHVQLHARRTGLHPVSRHVFRPPPRVESALVAFTRVPGPEEPTDVRRLVEGAFAHRRKTLANALVLAGIATRERAQEALADLGLPPGVRAEALPPEAFVELRGALEDG